MADESTAARYMQPPGIVINHEQSSTVSSELAVRQATDPPPITEAAALSSLSIFARPKLSRTPQPLF
jgi:hypothetical protein